MQQWPQWTQWLRDNRGLLVFILCFAFFRTAIADWNPIPSGSMRPTLLEGDVVLVDRLAYDVKIPLTDHSVARLADPQRGDVVTFASPKTGTRLIKRIVAVPGDEVELRDGALLINGRIASYLDPVMISEPMGRVSVPALQATESIDGSSRRVQYLQGASIARRFGPVVMQADQYFMMGDNRDNSEDSRYIGTVPRELIIGRAHRVLVSADILGHWLPRLDRTVSVIH